MDSNFNTVPNTGTFGNSVNKINENFLLAKVAIDGIELSTTKNKGIFNSVSSLETTVPSPNIGDWAGVGTAFPVKLYVCNTAGTWVDSGSTWSGGDINLSDYVTNTTFNSLEGATNNINVDKLIPLSTGYYTLSTATAAVPVGNLRKVGAMITFQSASGVIESYQYTNSNVANWTTLANWELVSITGKYGNLGIITNFDTIAKTGNYTAYGTSTGAPDVNYSWFIEHINSSAGAVTSYQRAVAYSTTLIIFERTKINSVWGVWIPVLKNEQSRSQNTNTSPSSKLMDDELKNTLDFRRMVFNGNANVPDKFKNSILNIELYNIDRNKNYTLAVLKKNEASSHNWLINVYEWINNNFGNKIAEWTENNHVISNNIERLPLTLNSSIVGYATIDWSKLSDGDSFSSMIYSLTGLNNNIIDNKQIGTNIANISDNVTKIKTINNLAYFKTGYYYNTSGILASNGTTKYTELIDISKFTEITIYAESFGQASTVIFANDGVTILGVIPNNGLQTIINLSNYTGYKYIAMSTGISKKAWLYGELKDYAELNYRISNTEKNKTSNYPFSLSANVPSLIKNAIKDIRLYDIDPNKDYSITVINKNNPSSSYPWSIKIYEITNGVFGNSCNWIKLSYVPSANIEVIYLEPNGSNFSATITIDWSQLPDGYNVSGLGYTSTGIMKEITANNSDLVISKNKFDIVLPNNIYLPTGNQYWIYDNSIILNDDLFNKDKYYLDTSVDIRYGNKLSKITSSGTKTFKIQSKEKLDVNYHYYVDLLTKNITVNTKTKATGKTINTLMITDSYGDIQWGDGMMGYINSFAVADGNTMSFKGTRTSYGYLGACISGWQSQLFYQNYVPLANRVSVNSSNTDPSVMCSPFVFSDDDTIANSYFSYSKYLSENSIANVDNVVFFLGINGGDKIYINNMITNILSVNPNTNIFVCLINPSGTYGNLDLTTTLRQVTNMGYISLFGNRESEHIYVIPTNATFDRVYGLRGSNQPTIQFDVDNINDVKYIPYDHHPSANGCKQLAWMIYNYLLYVNS